MSDQPQANLFLSEMTVVDHAYIDEYGRIIGGSFLPNFFVTGNVDPKESVVVDFSTLKKDIKALIDHPEIGFDHKLWIIEGHSGVTSIRVSETTGNYIITTQVLSIDLPQNAVRIIQPEHTSFSFYASANAGIWMQDFLHQELRKKYPGIFVDVRNSENTVAPLNRSHLVRKFRYVHGLRDSTSWGCQNIAHGHLSFIQAEPLDRYDELSCSSVEEAVKKVGAMLEYVMFVKGDNMPDIVGNSLPRGRFLLSSDLPPCLNGRLPLNYATERGYFAMSVDVNVMGVIVLDTETTIEYLVDFVGSLMKRITDVPFRLFVSEGLNKGSFRTF